MTMPESKAVEQPSDLDEAPAARKPSVMRRVGRGVWVFLGWLLVYIGAVFAGGAFWIRRTFGPISVDQMLMNLDEGGAGAPDEYVWTLVLQAFVIPLIAVLVLAAIVFAVRRRLARLSKSFVKPSANAGRRVWWRRAMMPLASLMVFAVGLAVFVEIVGVDKYIRSITASVTMADYYVAPETGGASTRIGAVEEQPRNLVVIYIESGEALYSDADIFGANLNEPLEDATADWQRFDNLEVYSGGGWTMAGIVGSECGVPLRGPGFGANDINSNDIGAETSEYLPEAVCLGDVLADAGYTNVFMGGADASFASKRDFLQSHGYDDVMDLNTWEEIGETEMSPWGLSDRRLMEHAKSEVTRLHESGAPFNLTLLTLDTHEPGYAHEYCPAESGELMASVVHCSMEQVAGFVSYMREMGYLEDTAVFITGDHPKMLGEDGAFYDELIDVKERPLFNRLWVPDGAVLERTSIDQLSVYPTLLDMLGLGRQDGRAGVGVSAFRPDGSDTGMLALSDTDYEDVIRSRSADLYHELWGLEGRAETGLEVLGDGK